MRLAEMLDGFRRTELIVLGDATLDWWHEGSARSLCREAPAPVVTLDTTRCVPGGAAHAAVNVAGLGGASRFVTVVGDDEAGRRLTDDVARRGVGTGGVVVAADRPTTSTRRLLADGHVLARIDEAGFVPLRVDTESALCEAVDRELSRSGAHVLVCDHGTGTVTDRVLRAVADRRDAIATLVVGAHDPARWRALRPTAVTLDLDECRAMLGRGMGYGQGRAAFVEEHGPDLLWRTGADTVVATVGDEGAVLLRRDRRPVRVGGVPAPVSHTTGAGEAFAAAFALALAAGNDLESCLAVAGLAASTVVDGRGAPVCQAAALVSRSVRDRRIAAPEDVAHVVRAHRRAGRSVVFTDGCFDVLHRGHVTYLRQARELGDLLVVGLNSDESVRRLKGPDRPVHHCEDRAALLAELRCVDLVCVFDGDSPDDLLRAVRPDVYVRGGDHTAQMLPDVSLVGEWGGQVRTVDPAGRA